jgi:endonuclease G, mitochondrial
LTFLFIIREPIMPVTKVNAQTRSSPPVDVLQEALKRWDQRHAERSRQKQLIDHGQIMRADTPERVQKRLSRLGVSAPEVFAKAQELWDKPLFDVEATPSAQEARAVVLERVLGKSDLVDVNFFRFGMRAARAVARISIGINAGRAAGYGTGSMISRRLLLTNNHVLPRAATAATSQAEFNYETDMQGSMRRSAAFALRPDLFFFTSKELDFSLVAVEERARDGTPLSEFGFLKLIEAEGKAIIGEYVNIIQHPAGRPKQLTLRENQIIDFPDAFMHYLADTEPGSSGSPVFNDQWEVVALHHAGVPKRDPKTKKLLTTDNKPWTSAMGEDKLAWVANEGIRVSRIMRAIKDAAPEGSQPMLKTGVFEDALPSLDEAASSEDCGCHKADSRNAGAPRVDADGSVVVPIEVRVRVGGGVSVSARAGLQPPAPGLAAPMIPGQPSPTRDTKPAGPLSSDTRKALDELRRAPTRTYFDAAKDAKDVKQYYQGLSIGTGASRRAQNFAWLRDLLTRTHTTAVNYDPAAECYPWVDLRPNLTLQSIYSGKVMDPREIILADAAMVERREAFLTEMCRVESTNRAALERSLEAQFPFNCEHVVCQSWFGKKEPMRGDLHHLFACDPGCNSFRGNTPYYEFPPDEEAFRDDCGRKEDRGNANKFEPGAGHGPVARATLYFLVRYPGQINNNTNEYTPDRLAMILAWATQHQPDIYEKHRNQAIFQRQGNRNPFVDYPEWIERVDFLKGLGP